MRKVVMMMAVVGLAGASGAAAQQTPQDVAPGARVRITVPAQSDGRFVSGTGRWVTGTLRSVSAREVSIQVDGQGPEGEYTVPLDAVRDFQVSRGEMTSANGRAIGSRRGAVTGLLLATAAQGFGYVISGKVEDGERCTGECEVIGFSGAHALRNGAVGAVGGALIGYLIGGRSHERWESVHRPRASLSLAPNGVGITLPVGASR